MFFQIAGSTNAPQVKEELYRLLYSYIVRRALCGLTSKNLNKTFARLISAMLKEGVSVEVFANAFSGQRGETVRFPDDEELRAAILSKAVYELFPRKERLSDVLWELECTSRTKYHVHTPKPENMSIEHILPQAWRRYWPLPDGRYAPLDPLIGVDEAMFTATSARHNALHTLDNLTLITVPGNAAASNSAFAVKSPWLKQSLLAMNLVILEEKSWDENSIYQRGQTLAALAMQVWPAPK